MSAEEHQAQQLAEWLESPAAGVPAGLDSDLLEGLYALRPDLAPPPRVGANEILAELLEGPLALPAQDLLAATAMADWLDSGGEAPGVLDDDVVEGLTALRPELAPPPSLTAHDILAHMDASSGVATEVTTASAAPANNHRWFLLTAAGGSGLLAVAAAALFTLTVNLQGGAPATVASAEPEVEESADGSAAREEQQAPAASAPRTTSSSQPMDAEEEASPAKKDAAKTPASNTAPAGDSALALPPPPPLAVAKEAEDLLDATTADRLTHASPADARLAGETNTLSAGSSGSPMAGGLLGGEVASKAERAERPARPRPTRPQPKPAQPSPSVVTTRANKREVLEERWAPPRAPTPDSAPSSRAPEAEPAPPREEVAIADLDDIATESDFGFDAHEYEDDEETLSGADAGGSVTESVVVQREAQYSLGTRARDRRPARRSKAASNTATPSAEEWSQEDKERSEAPLIEPTEPPSTGNTTAGQVRVADAQLRSAAVSGVGTPQRRSGAESDIRPPHTQGQPVAIHLSEAALARHDYATAQGLARSGLSLGGENTPERAWLYILDGDAAAGLGDVAGAERSWREAIRLNNTRTSTPRSEPTLDVDQATSEPD